jgi:hypothetical protein
MARYSFLPLTFVSLRRVTLCLTGSLGLGFLRSLDADGVRHLCFSRLHVGGGAFGTAYETARMKLPTVGGGVRAGAPGDTLDLVRTETSRAFGRYLLQLVLALLHFPGFAGGNSRAMGAQEAL